MAKNDIFDIDLATMPDFAIDKSATSDIDR
jgi:hypothetical protein